MSAHLDTESTPERQILDLRVIGFPELPAIGRYRYSASHEALSPHSHEGLIEVCVLDKGEQVFYLGDESYILRGKNLFLTLPGELHGTGENPLSKGVLYWFFIEPPGGKPFLGFSAEEAGEIRKALLNPHDRLFADGTRLIGRIERIFAATGGSILGRATIRTLLMELVLELVSLLESSSSRELGAPSKAISAAMEHIGRNIAERLRVKDMAAVAGLSVPRFKARFKKEVGFTPNAYLNHVRISAAKASLTVGKAEITAIAQDLGYPSSQYFSHVFRKFTGCTPSEYRNSLTSHTDGHLVEAPY
jgi:AraC-like DNA-binding protein